MRDKIANAKSTTWPADGYTCEEVQKIIADVKKGLTEDCIITIRWCDEDLKGVLEDEGLPLTEHNIAKMRDIVSGTGFKQYMIQCGWAYMIDSIPCEDDWDREVE